MAETTSQPPLQLSKPLPEPPSMVGAATMEDMIETPLITSAPKLNRRPTELATNEGQHPRIKKAWNAKNVIIAIPLGPDIGDGPGQRLMPLTKAEFQQMETAFKAEGFSTSGFDVNLSEDDGFEPGAQSKDFAPHEQGLRSTNQEFRVSIPDTKVWEHYVESLREEKLKALGVTSGDDEPSSVASPVLSSLDRIASPLRTFSPTFPSSTNSNANGPLINAFSPPFIPATSTNPSSHVPSIASPISIGGGYHNPRQSISFANDSKGGSPFQYFMPPQQQSPIPTNGMWSPQQLINAQGLSRGGSPAVLQSMPAVLNASAGSFSPSSFSPDAVPFHSNDFFSQVTSHARQAQQGNGYVPGGIDSRPETFNVQNNGASMVADRQAPEIATPIPGHRHNLSLTLQKEIDEAERQLEEEEADVETEAAPKQEGSILATEEKSAAAVSAPKQKIEASSPAAEEKLTHSLSPHEDKTEAATIASNEKVDKIVPALAEKSENPVSAPNEAAEVQVPTAQDKSEKSALTIANKNALPALAKPEATVEAQALLNKAESTLAELPAKADELKEPATTTPAPTPVAVPVSTTASNPVPASSPAKPRVFSGLGASRYALAEPEPQASKPEPVPEAVPVPVIAERKENNSNAEAKVVGPDATKPEVTQPEATEPKAANLETAKDDVSRSEAVAPLSRKAAVAEPEPAEVEDKAQLPKLADVEEPAKEATASTSTEKGASVSPTESLDFVEPPQAEPSFYALGKSPRGIKAEQEDTVAPLPPVTERKSSKLNVNAAEFKFDATSSFTPSTFSFGGDSITTEMFSQNRRTVSGPLSASAKRFNAAAAPFQPLSRSVTQPLVIPPPQSARSMTLPSSEFSFLSKGPSFNPDAPAFTPSLGDIPIPSPSFSLSPNVAHQPIFNFSSIPTSNDIIKLPKKSKALPIVQPAASSDSEKAEELFDENDRLKAPDGRQKRAKSGDDDGESVPQFAVPSHPLVSEGFAKPEEVRQPLAEVSNAQDNASKKPELLLATPEKLTVRPGVLNRPRSILEMSPDYDGKGWDSPTSQNGSPRSAEKGNHSDDLQDLPDELSVYHGSSNSERAMEDLEALKAELSMSTLLNAHEPEPSGLDEPITPKANPVRSRLNASAPAFELPTEPALITPALPKVNPPTQTSSPSLPVETTPVRKFSGLAGSRFAQSPPTSAESSPLPREPEKSVPNLRATQDTPISTNDPPTEETDSSLRKVHDTPASEARSDLLDEVISEMPASSPLPPFSADLMRSDAPSPSPHKTALSHRPVDKTLVEKIPESPLLNGSVVRHRSPPARPYSTGIMPTSDWDDTAPAALNLQGKALDGRINDLVGKLLQKRLAPLESSLSSIQHLLTTSAALGGNDRKSRSASAEVEHSDADDEDDVLSSQRRSLSPRKEHRLDRIRTVVQEALAMHQPPVQTSHDERFMVMQQTLDELRASMVRSPTSPRMSDGSNATIEQLRSRIITLEKGLRDAEDRGIKEQVSNNIATKRAAEFEGRLEIALDEIAHQREIVEDKTSKLRQFDERQHQQLSQTKMQAAVLQSANENLQKAKSDAELRNSNLSAKMRDLEAQSEMWKKDLNTMSLENVELRKAVEIKTAKIEDGVRVLDGMKIKFESTQEELGRIRSDVAKEQADWIRRSVEQASKIEILEARLEAEGKTRERFEKEMERLEDRERDAIRLKVELEQVKRNNTNLEELMQALRKENVDFQSLSEKHQREAGEAKEAGSVEVRRTKTLLQAEIEAANSQVKILRDSLEGEVSRLSAELSRAHRDADLQKERHDEVLHEITNAKVEAVHAANESAQQTLADVKATHDRALDLHKADQERVLQSHAAEIEKLKASHESALQVHSSNLEKMTADHERALQASMEDRERSEGTIGERLTLAQSKSEQLQDRVNHLEEQLEIAKSAARAAAQAAATRNFSPEVAAVVRKSELPEKISPQALRESIMVLQEQLQERETRIEGLEDDLSKVDREAPKKLGEKDNEIAWLRELLHVRVNELEEIIKVLSTEGFDHASVRDSVIRLKANIEMEQQERERAMAGGIVLPSLPSLSNFTSPRSVLPLAAALGNWRKGRDAAVERVSGMMSGNNDTPSKSPAASASSFLSGLLTPPASNLRQSPTPSHAVSSKSKRSSSGESSSKKSKSKSKSKHGHSSKHAAAAAAMKDGNEPSTPPLMRSSNYDDDAPPFLPLDISRDGSPSRAGPSRLSVSAGEIENPYEPPTDA